MEKCLVIAVHFVILFFISVYEVQSAAAPGDRCDGRVTRWCDFDRALWCRGDKCQCVHNHMHFDVNRQKCVSKVWFPCGNTSSKDVDMPNIECVDNARCAPSSPNAECRCKTGFQENDDGFCVQVRAPPRPRVSGLLGAEWSRAG